MLIHEWYDEKMALCCWMSGSVWTMCTLYQCSSLSNRSDWCFLSNPIKTYRGSGFWHVGPAHHFEYSLPASKHHLLYWKPCSPHNLLLFGLDVRPSTLWIWGFRPRLAFQVRSWCPHYHRRLSAFWANQDRHISNCTYSATNTDGRAT